MPNCPINTYFATFLDSCVSCPDQIKNCYEESPDDSLSCSKSCAGKAVSSHIIACLIDLFIDLINVFDHCEFDKYIFMPGV
jgi:hypothetical protein